MHINRGTCRRQELQQHLAMCTHEGCLAVEHVENLSCRARSVRSVEELLVYDGLEVEGRFFTICLAVSGSRMSC